MKKRRILWMFLLLSITMMARADRGGFYYRHFHVEAFVHKNNVWDITETMDVTFTEPRHGLYRYIPTRFWLKHDVSKNADSEQRVVEGQVVQDWRDFEYQSTVTDANVEGWEYTTEDSDDDNFVVRIGSGDREVMGEQRYVLHYKYTYRDDRYPNFDYLYHTVLGTDFDEFIEHFSFHIVFEKPLPADIQKKMEVYYGEYGKDDNIVEGLKIKATRKDITGTADNVKPNHGVTLYAQLPADYYEDVLTTNHTLHYVCFALTILFILWVVYSLFKTKRGHITKVIEFYPPEGTSSAEVGVITDESVDEVDLASLIPWLAGQGYITIRETEEKKLFGKKTRMKLIKRKDLPSDAPDYQKKMMELLFSGQDTIVDLKDLGEKPDAVEAVRKALYKHFTGKTTLTRISKRIFLYLPLLLFSTMTFATNSVVETFDLSEILTAIFLWGTPFALGACCSMIIDYNNPLISKWKLVGVFCLKLLVMAGVCACYCLFVWAYGAPMSQYIIVALFAVCFLLGELIGRFKVDTPYRVQMMGRLLGFREFIKTAEKPRLESLQAEDPAYFYKVLPYAMVFKLSDKWAKLFKDIDVKKPEWYDSPNALTGAALTSHMTSSLFSSTRDAIKVVSHDSRSASHSSSGGGFSGGGGGGGGGGSW